MFPGSGSGAPRPMNSWMHILRRLFAVALAVAGATVLVPAAATPARDDVVSWTSPTPGEGAVLGVAAKTTLSFRLGATSDGSGAMLAIRDAAGSPQGAVLRHTDGNPASATYTWKPSVSQVGVHRVTFSVSSGRGQRDSHARDPGRSREQAAARAVESGSRLPAAGAAQRSGLGNVRLGVRPAPHGCPHRPVALGSRDHAGHVPDARALPQRDPGARPGHVQGREDVGADPARSSARTARPAGCRAEPWPPSRRCTRAW